MLRRENDVLPPPHFMLYRRQGGDSLQLLSAEERTWSLAERRMLLNQLLKLPSLHDSLLLCTAEDKSFLKQGLVFCHLDFVPPQNPFPYLSTSTFHNLKNKPKLQVLDLCFPGVSVPHLTHQSLSSQEAAEILWAKPLLNWELLPGATAAAVATCSFACAFLDFNPHTHQHTCSHPLNPTHTLAMKTDTGKGTTCLPSLVFSRHDPVIFTASSSRDF